MVVTNSLGLWKVHLPTVDASSNKYTRGHAVIFGGYPMTGAARLAARACARIGAGLTTILVEPRALDVYAKHLESIMVRAVDGTNDARDVLSDARISSVLVGPGLGVSTRTKDLTLAALESGHPVVVDADAISVFSDATAELVGHLGPHCVLTPHEGEFCRLFDLDGSREDRAMAAARQCGAIIVLKGSQTVIAGPDGRCVVNPPASPHLATAGSGDVLAGIITGLIAQSMPSFEAACAGVWVHSALGRRLGIGMIADDMPDSIPSVLADFEEPR